MGEELSSILPEFGTVKLLNSKIEFENLHYRSVGEACLSKLKLGSYVLLEVFLPFCQNGRVTTFHHLKYGYLLTFGYQRISYSYFPF